MATFVKLSTGTLINLEQVVQITPEKHVQLTSGNTITITEEDTEIISGVIRNDPPSWPSYSPPPMDNLGWGQGVAYKIGDIAYPPANLADPPKTSTVSESQPTTDPPPPIYEP